MKKEENLRACPSCGSSQVVRNGHIHNGKAKFACKACGRQFVENPTQKLISDETKQLIDAPGMVVTTNCC
jgi:transposase-like protein